jgi:hypothetical protein
VTRFRLDKWYFDCVSPGGGVFIGYAAKLRWGPVRLSYGARITAPGGAAAPGGAGARQRQSLSFGTVVEGADRLEWDNASLGVRGTWTGEEGIANTVLLEGPDGGIEWRCVKTNAAVRLRVDGTDVAGAGYVERLTLTVPPWRLPFTELRWGRYVAADLRDHAVWIDMRGGTRRSWVWLDGERAAGASVENDRVRIGDRELRFEASRPVRCENVAGTLLGRFRPLARLLPRGVRDIREDKRVSDCVLAKGGEVESRGWSINEVVVWR